MVCYVTDILMSPAGTSACVPRMLNETMDTLEQWTMKTIDYGGGLCHHHRTLPSPTGLLTSLISTLSALDLVSFSTLHTYTRKRETKCKDEETYLVSRLNVLS